MKIHHILFFSVLIMVSIISCKEDDVPIAKAKPIVINKQIIKSLTPENNATDLSVFTIPQIVFSTEVGIPQLLTDHNINYKSEIDYYILLNGLDTLDGHYQGHNSHLDTMDFIISGLSLNEKLVLPPKKR